MRPRPQLGGAGLGSAQFKEPHARCCCPRARASAPKTRQPGAASAHPGVVLGQPPCLIIKDRTSPVEPASVRAHHTPVATFQAWLSIHADAAAAPDEPRHIRSDGGARHPSGAFGEAIGSCIEARPVHGLPTQGTAISGEFAWDIIHGVGAGLVQFGSQFKTLQESCAFIDKTLNKDMAATCLYGWNALNPPGFPSVQIRPPPAPATAEPARNQQTPLLPVLPGFTLLRSPRDLCGCVGLLVKGSLR